MIVQEILAILDVAKAGGNLINTVTEVFGAYWKPVAQARGEVKAEEIRERHRARKEQLREEGQFCMESRAELVRIEQSEREQQNIEAVVSQFVLRTEGHDNGTPPNSEWSEAFRRGARTASSDEMRTLWSRILQAEYEKQGSVGKRTMAIIQEMSMDDALLFEKVVRVLINDTFIYRLPRQPQALSYAGILYADVLRLNGARLVANTEGSESPSVEVHMNDGRKLIGRILPFKNGPVILISYSSDFKMGILSLSESGVELASVVETVVNIDAVATIVDTLIRSNYEVSLIKMTDSDNFSIRARIDPSATLEDIKEFFREYES